MQSVGKCALFLLKVGNVFMRKPRGLTWTHVLGTVLIAVLLFPVILGIILSFCIYYGEIFRIGL